MQRQFHQNTNNNLTHHHVAVSASTNSELLDWLNIGRINKARPFMLTAGIQTAGRGQHKRTWQSPIGNIYLSLYHPLTAPLSGILSLVVGYHLTRLPIIQNLNRLRLQADLPIVGVKWANDIGYYNTNMDKTNNHLANETQSDNLVFNKLAGILIEPVTTENRITGVIVGVGINIEAAPLLSTANKEGMDHNAVSLNQIINHTYDKHAAMVTKTSAPVVHQQSKPLTSPRAEDLYLPVSATILRALQQFEEFYRTPYAVDKFISEYSAVNVLAGRHVSVYQHHSPTTLDKVTDKNNDYPNKLIPESYPHHFKENVIQGVVVGINEDGSLRVSNNAQQNAHDTIDIYTGTIRLKRA